MSLSGILSRRPAKIGHIGFLPDFEDVSRRADALERGARRYGGDAAGDAVGGARAAAERRIRAEAEAAVGEGGEATSSIANSAVAFIMNAVIRELQTALNNIPINDTAQQTGFTITDTIFSNKEKEFFPYRRRNVVYRAIPDGELQAMSDALTAKVNGIIDSLPNTANIRVPNPFGIGGDMTTTVNMRPYKQRVKEQLVEPLVRRTIAPMLAQAQSATTEHVKKNVILVASLSAAIGAALGVGATYLIMRNR